MKEVLKHIHEREIHFVEQILDLVGDFKATPQEINDALWAASRMVSQVQTPEQGGPEPHIE